MKPEAAPQAAPQNEPAPRDASESLLLVTFRYRGPGVAYREVVGLLASTSVNAPGLIWKTWFVAATRVEAGSLHLFESAEALDGFLRGPSLAPLRTAPDVADLHVGRYATLNEIPLVALRRWRERRS